MKKKTDYEYKVEYLRYVDTWFVYRKGTEQYLFTDGRLCDWYKALKRLGVAATNRRTAFASREAAEQALIRYLGGIKHI